MPKLTKRKWGEKPAAWQVEAGKKTRDKIGLEHYRKFQPIAVAAAAAKARAQREALAPEDWPKPITVRLRMGQVAKLDAIAYSLDVRRSLLIQEAVDLWLEQLP